MLLYKAGVQTRQVHNKAGKKENNCKEKQQIFVNIIS